MFVFGRSFSVYCDNCGKRFHRLGSCPSIFETLKNFKASRAASGSFSFDTTNNKTLCYDCKKGISKNLEKLKFCMEELNNPLKLDIEDFLIDRDYKIIKLYKEGNDFYLHLENSLNSKISNRSQLDLFDNMQLESNDNSIIKIKLDKMMCQKLSKILGDISLMQHYIECMES